jgi:hypothetical protein
LISVIVEKYGLIDPHDRSFCRNNMRGYELLVSAIYALLIGWREALLESLDWPSGKAPEGRKLRYGRHE